MTYIPVARLEARAVEMWQQHSLDVGFDVERLLDEIGLSLVWDEIDDDNGAAVLGQLVPEQRLVVLNERHLDRLEERDGRLRRFTVGHEIGHWALHADAVRSGGVSLFDGERIWCRDGSPDPIERQAEMFSAALLMPKDQVLAALPKEPWKGWRPVYRLADTFLVNVTPMVIRIEQLGWGHRGEDGVPVSGRKQLLGQEPLFG